MVKLNITKVIIELKNIKNNVTSLLKCWNFLRHSFTVIIICLWIKHLLLSHELYMIKCKSFCLRM